MEKNQLFAILLVIFTMFLFGMEKGLEAFFSLLVLEGILLSMVLYPDVWANYVLTTGFWQYFARDFKDTQKHGNSMRILGWTGLLFLFILVIRQ